ncbi:alpha/beta hydrolase [Sphingobium sp. DEHP117]|uniref:alpha/beta hydrolase n=1 Tax=Sphingobium sp. DEHP117 TaxID=2993436 RepID=UPI0027D62666|nr:alpha/beta hydrolase fold domain-containing protein [Sphingobium sp. DEHP117]MDQ4419532.1 alpha/beta hydrolase [Sphingobium sp. DEHP117]
MRPDVAAYVAADNAISHPRLHEMPVEVARRVVRRLARTTDLPLEPVAVDRWLEVPLADGSTIGLRLFDDKANCAPGPMMLYFHGGGWALGDVDIYAPVCAEMARTLDLPVLSVEYRRAPEHPSPTGQRDCEAAARWVAGNPAALPVKATSLILAGDSCGGAYAISTAMALRDTPAALPVAAQLAFYPAADLATRYPSFREFATGYLLDRHLMRWFAEHFRPDDTDFRASPMAGNLVGLPPALVVTTELDPLRDQGRAYAAALELAGVQVVAHEAAGMTHGFLTMRAAIPSAQTELEAILATFKRLIPPR